MTLIGRTLAPEEVAARTLAAVRAGELYVITHDEALEPLRRRFQRLERGGPATSGSLTAMRATAILSAES